MKTIFPGDYPTVCKIKHMTQGLHVPPDGRRMSANKEAHSHRRSRWHFISQHMPMTKYTSHALPWLRV